MKEEQNFREEQLRYGGRYFQIMCALLVGMETFLLLVYFLSHTPGKPTLDRGYLHFYIAAIALGGSLLALTWLFRRRRWLSRLQLGGLGALLLWGCLFARYDVLHGNGGAALPQIMLFAAAGLRFSKAAQYGLNMGCWALYLLLLSLEELPLQTYYSEAINSGIYLFIACAVITITARFQTAQAEALRKVLQLQNENLDTMAGYVGMVQEAAEESRIMRHDLRHVASAVLERAGQGDLAAVEEIARRVLERSGGRMFHVPLRSYTDIPEIDAPLSKCAAWAESRGIRFSAALQPPEGIDCRAFSLVLLNALENACLAAGRQGEGEERRIEVAGESRRGEWYCFEIENTYPPGSVTIHRRTGLPAAREPGHGYGAKSIARIAREQGGYCRFQAGELFRLQVFFPIKAASGEGERGVSPAREIRQ